MNSLFRSLFFVLIASIYVISCGAPPPSSSPVVIDDDSNNSTNPNYDSNSQCDSEEDSDGCTNN